VRRVYVSRHDVTQNARIFAVEDHGAVQDVQEEVDVAGIRKIAGHGLKHARDQSDPHELVHYIQSEKLLEAEEISNLS